MGSSIFRFALVFTLISLAVPLALFALDALFNINLNSSFVPFIPFLGAAMYEGQRYAQEFGAKPSGGEMWLAALIMAVVGMVINVVLVALFYLVLPEQLAPLAELPPVFLAIGFGVSLIIAILICRLFVGLGARSHLKNAQRARK